jgi:hypothetical protein
MKKISLVLAVAALSGFAGVANAATANAVFGGAVANSCTLTAGTAGVMAPNLESDVLSSTETGGSASTVTALATARGFKVSAIAPTAFTSGDSTDATFAASYSISGPTTATDVAGATETTILRGSHTVAVNLTATKSSGPFANGTYAATVVVRCE